MPLDPNLLIIRRTQLGLSRPELAALLGMAVSNLERLEAGRRTDPNLSTAERLAAALGCRVDDLLDRRSPPPRPPVQPPVDPAPNPARPARRRRPA